MLGKVGNRFMEFAFGIALARLLVPADFGMIATISVFTGFVGMFTAGGMGQSLIRAKVADENDFTAVFTLQLAMECWSTSVSTLLPPGSQRSSRNRCMRT
jgi:teichuronic acid exporter